MYTIPLLLLHLLDLQKVGDVHIEPFCKGTQVRSSKLRNHTHMCLEISRGIFMFYIVHSLTGCLPPTLPDIASNGG